MTITDIVNKIYFLTKTDSTQFAASDMLILINNAYNRVVSLIMTSDNRWQWDDTNNTNFAIARTDLILNQQDYTLSVSHLKITRVEAAASSLGTIFNVLNPYDQTDENESLTYLSSISGVPNRYDDFGSSILLDPKPSYNCRLAQEGVAGLVLYFQRGPAEFTSAEVVTGTKVPGFNSLYHDLISLWVAYEYWLVNDPNMTTRILNQIQLKENALKKDYTSRNIDDHKIITMADINFM